jgi:hypothetical protein
MYYIVLTLVALAGDLALALLVAAFIRAGRGDHSAARRVTLRISSRLKEMV